MVEEAKNRKSASKQAKNTINGVMLDPCHGLADLYFDCNGVKGIERGKGATRLIVAEVRLGSTTCLLLTNGSKSRPPSSVRYRKSSPQTMLRLRPLS